jgi:hypothetical protein
MVVTGSVTVLRISVEWELIKSQKAAPCIAERVNSKGEAEIAGAPHHRNEKKVIEEKISKYRVS